ncbi:MAG: helix-hairpin-helix domain-containing protein [Clostridia bacterium]|nr:helix-hairpin-helix domain-containing protein [Clostridia bacterium]
MYITGEVANPGVYYIPEESRLDDLIQICGGFTQNADISELNLAERLSDSDKVEVPKIVNEEKIEYEELQQEEDSNLININNATKEELKTLNGIGDTLADNIINYRKINKFETIEDLLNVNGIGKSKFNSIKEYICVN